MIDFSLGEYVMKTDELIQRFLEETHYMDNEQVLLIMAYGSRVTNHYHANSDLDIFIVTEFESFIASMLIDGVPIDIHGFSLDDIKRNIMYMKYHGNMYFKSVLLTGTILKNSINLHEELLNLLNYQVVGSRRINMNSLITVYNHIENFKMADKNSREVLYFHSLELMRQQYHDLKNYSYISTAKVYSLYNNEKSDDYFLKLPNEQERRNYLNALSENDQQKRFLFMQSFFNKFKFKKIDFHSINDNFFFHGNKVKEQLIIYHNQVIQCEQLLLSNHPYANAFYYIIIEQMKNFGKHIECNQKMVEYWYCMAINAKESEERIQILESMFCSLDENARLDYSNYYVRLR